MPTANALRITELAAVYDLAPDDRSPENIYLWRDLGAYCRTWATNWLTQTGTALTLTTDPEPYAEAADQAADISLNGHFAVSTAHCDHPVWDTLTNVSYRIWHDVSGHGTDPYTACPFTVAGELAAWRRSAPDLPTFLLPAAFCETVLQLAYAGVAGDFGEQKLIRPTFTTAQMLGPIEDDR